MDTDTSGSNLKQVAQRLGVHYMTAYRYVRQGRLPAHQVGTAWVVEEEDLAAFAAERQRAAEVPVSAADTGPRVDWPGRVRTQLLAGSEVGAWDAVEGALAAGWTPQRAFVDLLAGSVATVGADVDAARASTAEQHLATATAQRVAARLGARFRRPGRSRGTVVMGAPEGERHALPVAIVSDLLRLAGFTVLELGADVPADAFAVAAERADRLVAVGVGVTSVDHLDAAAEVVAAVRAAVPDVAVMLGGQAVRSPEVAALLGVDAWAPDGESVVAAVEELLA